ncbi:MAG TPA: TetR/AcrR family transcriptional regulator [Chitinophagaceae bacterium]|nr:TetR/AcrR family transcriptional regulator [Chitinophagaceae bacterium]
MSPRTSDQLQVVRENRKQQILQAALKVFAAKGYDGATIAMIAKEAGIAKGLLYTYYASKENLLDELIQFGLQKAAAFVSETPLLFSGSKEAFAAGLRNIVNLYLQEVDFWRLYLMLVLQPAMANKIQQESKVLMDEFLPVFAEYFKSKGSQNPVAEAMLFGTTLDGLMFDMIVMPEGFPVNDVVDMIIEKFS